MSNVWIKVAHYASYISLILVFIYGIRMWRYTNPAIDWNAKKISSLSGDAQNQFGGFSKIGKVGTILRSQIPLADRKAFDKRILQAPLPKQHIDLPSEYDFSIAFPNMSSTVLDQKDCGSCWAFSVAGSASDRIRRKVPTFFDTMVDLDGMPVKNQLDPHLLASCDNCSLLDQQPDFVRNAKLVIDANKCAVGCDGGVIEYALIYLDFNGLISIQCNKGFIGKYKCHSMQNLKEVDLQIEETFHKKKHCRFYQFKTPLKVHLYEDSELVSPERMKKNEEAIQTEILLFGPVSAGYMVYRSFYEFYQKNPKGIYKELAKDDTEEGGHAIILTGWGEENGVKYWIARNSWGQQWADKGYFRILRGQNFCQCECDVWAVQLHAEWFDWAVKLTNADQHIPDFALVHNFPDTLHDIESYLVELEQQKTQWFTKGQKWLIASIIITTLVGFGSWYLLSKKRK
jgi:hypothetical protein